MGWPSRVGHGVAVAGRAWGGRRGEGMDINTWTLYTLYTHTDIHCMRIKGNEIAEKLSIHVLAA